MRSKPTIAAIRRSLPVLIAALVCLVVTAKAAEPAIALFYDGSSRPVTFAAAEIRKVQAARGEPLQESPLNTFGDSTSSIRLVIASGAEQSGRVARQLGISPPQSSPAQAYSVRRVVSGNRTTIAVLGADPAGAMYGGLDLAEALRLGTLATLADAGHKPYIERRGIKFNIPLDARTPSYSDNSHAVQNNIAEMWSFDFWREFLDEMARHRYNVLTLWSLHPFPSMVKVPEYPDVALNDVMRTTIPMDDTFSHSGNDMVRPDMLAHLETLKKLSIEEKIQFWRDVMQYAADRGIETYIFTWNIFTFGAEGKYGITPSQTNQKTIDYFRASVRELVLTYPQLAGIGITSGEQMQNRQDEFSKEKWLWKTYGEGILDARKLQPGRNIRLIHRYHQTAQSEILDEWKNYPDTFELSFKYSIAHMYSVPDPPFIKPVLPSLPPGRKTWLTVRNDDIYSFRWGDAEFARAFIRNMPPSDKMAGFYMGPDGYLWGREFLSTEPETPRELVISKQWFSFLLWGRLSYDPDLPDSLFQSMLAQRFPEVDSARLLSVWAGASKIFPRITSFFWGDIDLRWFPEACLSHPRYRGFYTVKHFIEGQTMPESGILNILDWRRKASSNTPMNGVTPLEVAAELEKYAQGTLKETAALRQSAAKMSKELRLTLGDLEAMAHLGNYYAAKIRGAADLALYDLTSRAALRESAVKHLENALTHWKRYARAYTVQYEQPRLYNRVGVVDIPALASKVAQDVDVARLWVPQTIAEETRKGRDADVPFRK